MYLIISKEYLFRLLVLAYCLGALTLALGLWLEPLSWLFARL